MRKKVVAGNWKMNNDLIMSNDLIKSIKLKLNKKIDTDVFISPSFPFLNEAIKHSFNQTSVVNVATATANYRVIR